MEDKIKRVTEKDKVTEFLEEKTKREEELKELKTKKVCLEEEIEIMEESYTRFVNNFLFKDSDIKAKINFDGE